MRDIKFRAYNPRDKKMHYDITGFEFFGDGNVSGVFIDGAFYLIEEIELMQFTGLYDKNGKEIFEGDIIKCYTEIYFVEFREDRGGFFPFACGDGCGCCENEVAWANSSEIIGNIYDN